MASRSPLDIKKFVDIENPQELGVTEAVYYPLLKQIIEESKNTEALKEAIKKNIAELIPKHITKEDIFASVNYNMHIENEIGSSDDISLSCGRSRRVRTLAGL